jgi:outer membrane protein assembly factor BamE (lipoprotein component of BamABCDE complex)
MKVIIISFFLLSGCSSFGTVRKSNDLEPGMSTVQVKEKLGNPNSTQFIYNKWVWKYSLHQYWKGNIPYYLIFNNPSFAFQK